MIKKEENMDQIENKNSQKIEAKFEKDEDGLNKIVGITVGNVIIDFQSKEMQPSLAELDCAISKILGFPNASVALDMLYDFTRSLPFGLKEETFNRMIALIAAQKPKDSIEAVLLGQFFLLNEIGTHSWRRSYDSDMLNHADFFSKSAVKFFSLSHQAIHALAKHKTKGVQQINVVHMHDNSKAIIAKEVGGGNTKN